MNKVALVETRFGDTEFKPYLDSFKYDCLVRNLSPKSLDCYYERLGCLFQYLQGISIHLVDVSKQAIQGYIMSLSGRVSDETINGRIRVYRVFFNYLVAEGLWEGDNPLNGVSLLRTAKRVKPVVEPEIVQKLIGSLNRSDLPPVVVPHVKLILS